MPDKMFLMAENEGIGCEFFNLPHPILGLYDYRYGEPPIILLDNSLRSNRRLLRCVLAEELGHHYTTSHNVMVFSRIDKYMYMKYEKLALWWATNYLMPFQELIKTVNSGVLLTREIAEYFDVTELFAGTGIQLYRQKKTQQINGLLKKPEE